MRAALRCWSREPSGERRLVCLPAAGGLANSFRPLARAMPDGVDVVAVDLPGRGTRRADAAPRSVAEAADAVAAAIADGPAVPTALLGHSYGALVAYETARRLGTGAVRGVVVSHSRAPDRLRHDGEPWWRTDDEDALVAQLRRLGATPPGMLDEPELRALFLPAVRADLHSYAAYVPSPAPDLDLPVVAVGSTDDPLVPRDDLFAWRHATAGPFVAVALGGGHFLPQTDPAAFSAAIEPLLRRRVFGDPAPAVGGAGG